MDAVERAQPWLGTRVSVRIYGLAPALAHPAIDSAFGEIAAVHRLMSFHDPASDISRLNREAAIRPVKVHPHTRTVLGWAQLISAHSGGLFDISIGRELVSWNLLPAHFDGFRSAEGSWREIELQPGGTVFFRKPLCIDLGGIAKGYAVDRAVAVLRRAGVLQAVVNAGGDIRVLGSRPERIALDLEFSQDPSPVLELAHASVASSSGHIAPQHVDALSRQPARRDRFVSVIARRCIVADALTKIVMASGTAARGVLRHFRAAAHIFDPASGWQHL